MLVAGTLDHDGGRDVTVHLPDTPPEAVVFAADGELVSAWGADLEAAGLPPTAVVGVHRAVDDTPACTSTRRRSIPRASPPTNGSSSTTSAPG